MTHAFRHERLLVLAIVLWLTIDLQRAAAIPPAFGYKSAAVPRTDTLGVHIVDASAGTFYRKVLDFEGIPIRSSEVVSDVALVTAKVRLTKLLAGLGRYRAAVIRRLTQARVELHVIGRAQAVTDLPENTPRKGEKIEEFGGLTLDERTRGTGGRLASCGEENLLALPDDRYVGKDICTHEFSHALFTFGLPAPVHERFVRQFERSLESGRWTGEYAGTTADEFFAELTVMYFGRAREGFKKYDPEAYALFDDFYNGRFDATDFGGGGR